MNDAMSIGIILGFGVGVVLMGFVFYTLYLQIETEFTNAVSDIKKSLGYMNVRFTEIRNQVRKDGL